MNLVCSEALRAFCYITKDSGASHLLLIFKRVGWTSQNNKNKVLEQLH